MNEPRLPDAARRSASHAVAVPVWTPVQRAIAVAVPAVTIAALAIAILAALGQLRTSRAWVAHTRDVLLSAQTTVTHLQEIEASQRGHLLTGDEAYLVSYEDARRALGIDMRRLHALTADNVEQQRRLDAMQPALDAELAEVDSSIALRAAGDVDGAAAFVRAGRGRGYMAAIRREMDALSTAETTLLAARQEHEDAARRTLILVVIAGAGIAVALALYTNARIASAADRHAAQAQRLAEQAAELEIQAQQLHEQQIELETTNEHLQEQATELEAQQAELEMQTEELSAANADLVLANEREREARAQADRARDEAEQANRAKSQFLSMMSHELRTPLNGIGGHAQLIELGIHGPVTDAQQLALGRITRAQQHLLSLINDILNLSRIEAGKLEYDVRDVPIDDVVADVVPMVEPILTAKGIALAIDVDDASLRSDDGDGARIWADRDRLRQVLLNLLSNAAKFTPPNGRVTLRAHAVPSRPDAVAISVADTGYGIPANRLAAIFDPFVQVHRNLAGADMGSTQGTGLGLTISRDLVRGMGGDIAVESAVGEGSTFTLTLRRVVSATGDRVDRRSGEQRRVEVERRVNDDRRQEPS